MKKVFYTTLCLVMLTMLCNSCSKVPINNNVEGHWQLLEFTT